MNQIMIERVAAIIWNKCHCSPNRALEVAKAAIEVMREPSEEMEIVAGNQAYIVEYYRDMIDAALK